MKPRQIELILTIATVAVTITSSTPIPSKDPIVSRSETTEPSSGKVALRRQKVIGTCLRIAPDLPPCNFDSEATWRSRSSEILHGDPGAESGYPVGELPEYITDGSGENILTGGEATEQKDGSSISSGQNDLEEFDLYENEIAITAVYYLEGCLPARLPFDLPSCPIDELQTIRMNKLVPFQLPHVRDDALIFPEVDVKQIEFSHRQSRAPPASQSHEEGKENDSGFDGSSKSPGPVDPPSSFVAGDEHAPILESRNVKGVQDFHKTMLKSSIIPRTGTASTKYVNTLPTSGLTPIVTGYTWVSGKNKEKSVSWIGKSEQKPNPEYRKPWVQGSSVNPGSISAVDGSREFADVSGRNKNRVQ